MTCRHKSKHALRPLSVHHRHRRARLWTCEACGDRLLRLTVGARLWYQGPEAQWPDWRVWVEQASWREQMREEVRTLAQAACVLAGLAGLGVGGYYGGDALVDRLALPVDHVPALAALAGVPDSGDAESEAVASALLAEQVPAYLEAGQRIHDVGWRLLVAGAADCPASAPRIGVSLAIENLYPSDLAFNTAFGGGHTASLGFVAAGSPAAQAGLRRGDRLLAVGGHDVSAPASVDAVLAALAAAAKPGQPYRVRFQRGDAEQETTVAPVLACPQRLRVSPRASINANTDAASVITVHRGTARPEHGDGEVAYVIGHEIGHMIVRTPPAGTSAWSAKATALVRAVRDLTPERRKVEEFASDAVGVRLMVRAGYNPHDAVRMERRFVEDDYASARSGGVSHPSASRRLVSLERVIQGMALRDGQPE